MKTFNNLVMVTLCTILNPRLKPRHVTEPLTSVSLALSSIASWRIACSSCLTSSSEKVFSLGLAFGSALQVARNVPGGYGSWFKVCSPELSPVPGWLGSETMAKEAWAPLNKSDDQVALPAQQCLFGFCALGAFVIYAVGSQLLPYMLSSKDHAKLTVSPELDAADAGTRYYKYKSGLKHQNKNGQASKTSLNYPTSKK